MSNKTAGAVMDAAEFETPVEQTLDLPPLAILRINDKVDFVLKETAVIGTGEDQRIYYRGVLLADLDCETKEKGAEKYELISFKKGDEVTVPGAGSLDYQMARIANKKSGSELDATPKWAVLSGDRFIVERLEDDKMKDGKHKGKKVKTFAISYAPRKK